MPKAKKSKIRVLYIMGTRPDTLKMVPVITEAAKSKQIRNYVCLTAQHREMVDPVLKLYKIKPDFDLNVMKKGQDLSSLTERLLPKLKKVMEKVQPHFVVVQGDTTTSFIGALQAFYMSVPILHIEAGLRSGRKYHPYPEEMNRVLISRLADYHFAPTTLAKEHLLSEGISNRKVTVTGNTVVDALKLLKGSFAVKKNGKQQKKMVLVTAHRRESFGKPLKEICEALKGIVKECSDVEVVYPVHMNPNVQKVVSRELKGVKGINLKKPCQYDEFVKLLHKSHFVLTDSGGIQEEAPSFGKPVLVMREVTERMEAVKAGTAKLVGTSKTKIMRESKKLINSKTAYNAMVKRKNPFGDGQASKRIVKTLIRLHQGGLKDS